MIVVQKQSGANSVNISRKVMEQLPKKTNTTKTTNRMAYKIVSVKLSMVFKILSEVFTITPSFTSLGSDFCRRTCSGNL